MDTDDLDDLDELIGATGPTGGHCTVGWWLRSEHPDAARLAAAVSNPSAPQQAVADAFARRGMVVSIQAIGRHRRGVCSCPK